MTVQVIIELCQGAIDEVTIFQFKEDATEYYKDHNGPELENSENPLPNYEIKWFQDIEVRCAPVGWGMDSV